MQLIAVQIWRSSNHLITKLQGCLLHWLMNPNVDTAYWVHADQWIGRTCTDCPATPALPRCHCGSHGGQSSPAVSVHRQLSG